MTEPKRLSDVTAAQIAALIEAGEWIPGQKLPTSKQLGERFGVHERTVDAAMATLIDRGIVVGYQGGRRYVAGAHPEDSTGEIERPEPAQQKFRTEL